ncbi:MAG: sulfatase [Flavobacteriaceae bacterium]
MIHIIMDFFNLKLTQTIRSFIIPLLSLLFWWGCGSKQTEKKSPNIIWLVAEDLSPEFLPMYGDLTTQIPHLEALAKDGVVFENAYSPVPVCAPARSALITGMYPTTLGTHNMRTYNAYKEDNEPSIGIPSYSPRVLDGVKMFTQYLRAKGYYCTNNAKEDYNFKKTTGAWDESSPKAHWKNRKAGQSFFSVFNFGITHESQIWNQANSPLLVDPKILNIPAVFPDTPEVRKDLAVNYSNLIRLDKQIGKIIDQLKAENLYENSILFFYGDHGGPFPRYKRALYETGIKVPLIIKFAKQQKGGTRNKDLISFIDFAPSVLSLAGINPPEIMQGRAQFGAYRSAEKSEFIFASSDRFDEQVDRLRALRWRNFKYIKNFHPEISNAIPVSYREQMSMMQNLNQLWREGKLSKKVRQWFATPKPQEELYQIDNDPYELNNLADKEAFKDTLVFLRKQMDTWILETRDLGAIPEKELIENWLPNGKKVQLEALTASLEQESVSLTHPKKSSTIVWKTKKDSVWNVYTQPLKGIHSLQAKAVQIGFKESPVFTMD